MDALMVYDAFQTFGKRQFDSKMEHIDSDFSHLKLNIFPIGSQTSCFLTLLCFDILLVKLNSALRSATNYKLVANPVHNEYQLPLMYRQATDHFRRQTKRSVCLCCDVHTYRFQSTNAIVCRSFVVRSLSVIELEIVSKSLLPVILLFHFYNVGLLSAWLRSIRNTRLLPAYNCTRIPHLRSVLPTRFLKTRYEAVQKPLNCYIVNVKLDYFAALFSTFCVNVKMQYTLNQRLFLVKQYWIPNSITATQRAYQREFGVRNPPKRNTILGLVNKLETIGSLVSEKGKHRSSRLPTVVVDVRARLEQSPKKSLRRLSQETGYTYSMCQRAAKSAGLEPSFFDDRIISRNLWPPRSPDLTTPGFFLWGYLKDRVYTTRPQALDDLKHNITQEIQAIDNRVLQRVASNMKRRVELCLMQDGGHFQHLL
ncbi:hypothetical protein ANN_00171 [Periplaneta americana]|uniref:DUF4817 domain-containing protein n=1 Tax=Periplaneta americana TaxID=6978 RepID=A0ABQ8TQ40_PERAM|nr:hypothetical protein ANN_00171 [Periplaneta americana]